MSDKLCIRNKILIFFFILLMCDLGVVFLLENRFEKELAKTQKNYNQLLSNNTLLNMIIGGDIHSNFLLVRGYSIIKGEDDSPSVFTIIRKFRNQVLAIFGVSLLMGVAVSIIVAKSVTRPILQLTDGVANLSTTDLDKRPFLPKCTKIQALTENLKHMEQNLLEHHEEKSRLTGVEITKNLAAGIAHEIKNPINTVGLIVDYLQTNLSPDDAEKRYEFYKLSENMKSELKRINRIVEGFLRLTKPRVYQFNKEDINSIIKDSVVLYETEMIRESIKVHLNLDYELPPVKADRDKLNQVFSNLILNAIEAMPRGGDITFTTLSKDEDRIEVRVADNGIGIPYEDIEKIYSPYYTTKKQGFGLGLSLIHDIIHKHHGKITINSKKGEGTEFMILLLVDFDDE